MLAGVYFSASVTNHIYAKEKKDSTRYVISDARLDSIIKADEPFAISFVGNGNIQSSLESGAKIPTNTGVGVSISKYLCKTSTDESGNVTYSHQPFFGFYKVLLDGSINVASTADTLVAKLDQSGQVINQNTFGSSILTPLNAGGGQAVDLSITLYSRKTYGGFLSGIQFGYTGSNRNWQIPDSANSQVIDATTNSVRIRCFHDFVVPEYRKDYGVTIALGYAYNGIAGNLGLEKNSQLREKVLGTDRTAYHGFELSMAFRLKNLKVLFSYPIYSSKSEVSGLTGGRIITGIQFVGGFGLKID